MKKLLLLLTLMLLGAGNLHVMAQDEQRELPRNTISLNVGPGLVTSEIVTYRGFTIDNVSLQFGARYYF